MARIDCRSAPLDGTGYVFFNPDNGEEYSPDHPIKAGTCGDAERIRRSTAQEDCLYGAVQAHWQAAESARRECSTLTARVAELEAAVKSARADALEEAVRAVEAMPRYTVVHGLYHDTAEGHSFLEERPTTFADAAAAIRALPRSTP